MEGKEPIEGADVQEAMDTIKAIEFMGFAMEETAFKPKWFAAINHSMKLLRDIHDDLVSRLPQEVIEAERAKSMPQRPPVTPKIIPANEIPVGSTNGAA